MHVCKDMHVSAAILVHFDGWQSIISTGFLLNSKKKKDIYKAFLLGLRMYSSLCVYVSIITNPVETA